MKIDKVYIMHYKKGTDREIFINNLLENINIPYEIITDFDREDITDDMLKKYYDLDPIKCLNKLKLWGFSEPRILNYAEISLTIKHIIALYKISKECENAGLILENDAIPFFSNFMDEINNSINEDKNWDAIFLGKGCGDEFINNKKKERISENLFKIDHPASNCTESFCIKSDVSKKIADLMVPFQLPIDFELAFSFYKMNLNVYWRLPSIFEQGSKNGKCESGLRI